MADLQISQLPALAEAGVQSTDVLAVADLSASETKKVTVKDLLAAGVALIDAGDIPAAKVGTLGTNQVATAAIQDSAVTNAKLANSSISLGGLTLALGSTDATPALNLSDATNYPTSSLSGTITNAQLAGSITGDKLANSTVAFAKLNLSDGDIGGAKITSASITSTQLAANSVGASQIAANAVGTSEVASNAITNVEIASATIQTGNIAASQITASLLANNAVTTDKIQDGAVTAAKLSGTLQAASLADGSVTTAKIADDAVTSAKLGLNSVDSNALANNSVDTDAVVNSAITDAKIAAVAGTKITAGTIPASALNTANIDRGLNVASGKIGIQNSITAGTKSGITFTDQGLISGIVDLVPSDLPLGTASAAGIASFPSSGGLSVSGAGAVSISATVTANTVSGITFNSFGQITAASILSSADLPTGTASAKGAVIVPTGGPLSINSSGEISVSDSGVTAGTGVKVTVTSKGIVTNLTTLAESDLPNHSAALLTSGTLDVARLGANAITGNKLANASTVLFGSVDQTGFPSSQFTGQFFFDSVLEDLYIFDGNAYQPVTTLTKGSLIFGGTYNATTSKMTAVTAAGASKGLAVNSNLPTPSSTMDGVFVIVAVGGTPSAPAPVTQLNPPDYILGVTSAGASSYQEIDLSATVQGQIASNVSYTPFGQLSSTNLQAAVNELETEKVSTSGATFTGPVIIDGSGSNTGSLTFEGSTADNFETTLGVVDPTTSDKTLLLPNENGTLISTGGTGTVTSTMILDGTILNADINTSAAIALTKLENLQAARLIVGSSSNVPTAVAITGDIGISDSGVTSITAGAIVNADINASAAIAASKIVSSSTSGAGVVQLSDSTSSTSTSLAATANAVKTAFDLATTANSNATNAAQTTGSTFTGNIVLANQKETRFSEATAGGSNYVSLKAPSALSGNVELTLPGTAGSNGQVLSVDGSGNLSFISAPSASNPTFSGDLLVSGGNIEGFGSLQAPFSSTLTFTVTVASKTAAHRYSGSGSSNGYKIDGIEAPFITLTPGRTYKFDQSDSSNSGHPLRFYLEANKTTAFTTGVTTNGTPGSSGAYTEIVISDTTPQILHYQCSAHGLMGNSVQANSNVAAAATTINNNGDNRLITGSGTANTLEGESGLTYDGGTLAVTGGATLTSTLGLPNDTNLNFGTTLGIRHYTSDPSGSGWITGEQSAFFSNTEKPIRFYNYVSGSTTWEPHLTLDPGGAVTAYHNGSAKIATSNTGVTITGVAVATSFTGDLTGNADTVTVTADNSTDTTHYPLFVSATSGSLAGETDNALTYNPSSGYLSATRFIGRLQGSAGQVTASANNSTDETVYLTFVDGATGDQEIETDTGLTYNPSSGNITATKFTDDKGNLRSIPSNAQSSAYVAVAADAGKAIYISTGGVTINNSVFSAGDAITIINNSASDQTITKGSGVTLYNTADATDANRTLAQRGMATIWFASASVAYISGAGLS